MTINFYFIRFHFFLLRKCPYVLDDHVYGSWPSYGPWPKPEDLATRHYVTLALRPCNPQGQAPKCVASTTMTQTQRSSNGISMWQSTWDRAVDDDRGREGKPKVGRARYTPMLPYSTSTQRSKLAVFVVMLKYRVPHGYQHANNSVIGPAVINNSLRVPSTRTVFAGRKLFRNRCKSSCSVRLRLGLFDICIADILCVEFWDRVYQRCAEPSTHVAVAYMSDARSRLTSWCSFPTNVKSKCQ